MTGGPWTRSMKVVHGPGPKRGSMDPWSLAGFVKHGRSYLYASTNLGTRNMSLINEKPK